MKVLINEKFYYQQGKNLAFHHNTKTEMQTTKHTKEQPYFALNTVLNDFRKHELFTGKGFVTELELYFDDELVATLVPCFTIHEKHLFHVMPGTIVIYVMEMKQQLTVQRLQSNSIL